MARPREFDMDQALDAALSTFWTQGYKATSMTDLMEATGLHKGSLYKAFDDKHDLFMKSLIRYLDGTWTMTQAMLTQAETPLDGLRAWLQGASQLCSKQPIQRGCMAMNTAIELGPHDVEVAELLRSSHARVSELLTETIRRGQREGQLRTDLTAEQLAKSLFIFTAGLLGTSKILGDTIDSEEMVAAHLQCITPPEGPTRRGG
jgi:TetR/AcrR family transcriptional repressor of nem operon